MAVGVSRDTGGPAFPWGEHGDRLGGMTLRDYFAASIAQGILAGGWASTVPLDDLEHGPQLAAFAYQAADDMLRERAK